MKVKFQSRSRVASGIKATPTGSMTNLLLVLICFGGYISVCDGQQVFWLYKLPSARSHYYTDQQAISSNENEIDSEIGFNGPNDNLSNWNFKRQLMMPFIEHQNEQSDMRRYVSNYDFPSAPILAKNFGYGSVPVAGSSENGFWPFQPDYYHGLREEDETVNRNVLMLMPVPKRVVLPEDENEVSGSDESTDSKSGSLELRRVIGSSSLGELRDFYPLAPHVKMGPLLTVAVSAEYNCNSEGPHSLYHAVTGSCYTIGTRGPCGDKMVFIATDNINGNCECDHDSFDRPMIRIENQCHFLYTQATCPQGYWLTAPLSPNSDPVCQPNPCLAVAAATHRSYFTKKSVSFSKFGESDVVLFKGECVSLNQRSSHCKREDEVVVFPQGSVEPACGIPKSRKRLHRRQISSVPVFRCGPNMTRLRSTGRCVRMIRLRPAWG